MTGSFTDFKNLVQRYLLPADTTTTEEVCRLWTDPIPNNSSNRLPYFLLPIDTAAYTRIKNSLGGAYSNLSAGVIKPFEETSDSYLEKDLTTPLDVNSAFKSAMMSTSVSDPSILSYIQTASDRQAAKQYTVFGVGSVINTRVYNLSEQDTNSRVIKYIKLYIISPSSVWEESALQGTVIPYSRLTRSIAYYDQPADAISLSMLVYNTFLTAWLPVYTSLLKESVRLVSGDATKRILLFVPLAGGGNNFIYRKFDCDIVNIRTGNKFEDLVRLDVSMLVNSTLKTQISVS